MEDGAGVDQAARGWGCEVAANSAPPECHLATHRFGILPTGCFPGFSHLRRARMPKLRDQRWHSGSDSKATLLNLLSKCRLTRLVCLHVPNESWRQIGVPDHPPRRRWEAQRASGASTAADARAAVAGGGGSTERPQRADGVEGGRVAAAGGVARRGRRAGTGSRPARTRSCGSRPRPRRCSASPSTRGTARSSPRGSTARRRATVRIVPTPATYPELLAALERGRDGS